MNFDKIPDPKKQLEGLIDKYEFGKATNNIAEVKKLKPIFAFDYMSFEGSEFCFNSTLIDRKKDYLKFLEELKKLSSKTFDFLSTEKRYHFHDVNFDDTHVSESTFFKSITVNSKISNDIPKPTVYQFKIFEEARIFGFFYKGIFYPVWFDRKHRVYKRK